MTNWGTGTPRRELLHVDDLASACLYLLEHFDGPKPVNVAPASTTACARSPRWWPARWVTPAKPTGIQPNRTERPRKLLDVSVLREAGWQSRITLREGIDSTVAWYRANAGAVRK
ncbi:NAD dependent epimerase/dehydratase family protein [Mycobacterium kansasii 662]|uniref:NAD dependent epimerase/dehydratase family protein n=1 Tax=Mycobacterium kansasii 662 TaxID=1299326 RepID=X7XQE9_MYCKA|nr:NAD dependent epimerase/dehydratase family protein [Mycobacterium kansasii 662]